MYLLNGGENHEETRRGTHLFGIMDYSYGYGYRRLGITQESMTKEEQGKELVAKGSAIEAFGNIIQALGNTALFLDEKRQSNIQTIIGCWLQAGGNSTIAIGTEIEIHQSEDEGLRLNAIGSGVQSLGAAFQASGAAEAELSITRSLEVASENLTTLGAYWNQLVVFFRYAKRICQEFDFP